MLAPHSVPLELPHSLAPPPTKQKQVSKRNGKEWKQKKVEGRDLERATKGESGVDKENGECVDEVQPANYFSCIRGRGKELKNKMDRLAVLVLFTLHTGGKRSPCDN